MKYKVVSNQDLQCELTDNLFDVLCWIISLNKVLLKGLITLFIWIWDILSWFFFNIFAFFTKLLVNFLIRDMCERFLVKLIGTWLLKELIVWVSNDNFFLGADELRFKYYYKMMWEWVL